jgi:hypothetical protein
VSQYGACRSRHKIFDEMKYVHRQYCPYLCSRFLQTPPHDDARALRYPSPPSGWDGTRTRQLPNMHGVQQKTPARFASRRGLRLSAANSFDFIG